MRSDSSKNIGGEKSAFFELNAGAGLVCYLPDFTWHCCVPKNVLGLILLCSRMFSATVLFSAATRVSGVWFYVPNSRKPAVREHHVAVRMNLVARMQLPFNTRQHSILS